MSNEKLTDGQTDRKRCIRAHQATCTGGLKNYRDLLKFMANIAVLLRSGLTSETTLLLLVTVILASKGWLSAKY